MIAALAILRAGASGLLSLLARVPLWVWPALALVLWGLWNHHAALAAREVAAEQTRLATRATTVATESAQRREAEHVADATQRRIADELQTAQARAHDERIATARRLRQRAAAFAAGSASNAATAAACRRDDIPAVAVLRDSTVGDLEQLAADADAVSNRLGACQRYIREVIDPGAIAISLPKAKFGDGPR